MGFYNPHEEADPVWDADREAEADAIAVEGRRYGNAIASLLASMPITAKQACDLHEAHITSYVEEVYQVGEGYEIFFAAAMAHLPRPMLASEIKEADKKLTAAIAEYAEVSAYDHAANRRADAADLANDLERV